MINCKNTVFNALKTYISSVCSNYGSIENNASPTAFPYLLFVQKDNPSYLQSADSGSSENHVQPMIQIDVFMNKNDMVTADKVMDKADEFMVLNGFKRIFGPQPISSGFDGVYREVARYQAIVKQNAPNDFTVI